MASRKLEMEILLSALLETVERIEIVAELVIRLNNSLRGLQSFPIRLHASVTRPSLNGRV